MTDTGTGMSSILEFEDDIANAKEPLPLPPTDYHAVIRGVEQKMSIKGNKYLDISFFVGADQYPQDYVDGNPDGTTLHYRRIVVDNTAMAKWSLKKFCEAIGAPMGRQIDTNQWLGLAARLTIENKPYENSMRSEIKAVTKLAA